MRRGSLGQRFIKCGKPGCACADDPERRHGPYHSLTRTVNGKTRSRFLGQEAAEIAARQIEDGRAFRREIDRFWEACEVLADEELDAGERQRQDADKKGGSRKHFAGRGSTRSRRS
jgi:Family of unknown function (DUF6788)